MDTRAESKCLSNLPALIKGTDDRNQHNPLPCDQVVMFCLCKNNTIRNIVNLASSGMKHFRPARAKYGEETRPAETVDGGVSPRRHLRAQRRLSLARGFYVLGGFSLLLLLPGRILRRRHQIRDVCPIHTFTHAHKPGQNTHSTVADTGRRFPPNQNLKVQFASLYFHFILGKVCLASSFLLKKILV